MPLSRCPWSTKTDFEQHYHDTEWGVPVFDDKLLFEFILLESMQAGLSWRTILKKREDYRLLFDQFDPKRIANYDSRKVESLMNDARIIRHKGKIQAAITNAQAFLKICDEKGSFASYMWGFVDGNPIINNWVDLKEVPASTPLSIAISKDMKKRGFAFFGPTICYAHMQATGMVNDHLRSCFRHQDICSKCTRSLPIRL